MKPNKIYRTYSEKYIVIRSFNQIIRTFGIIWYLINIIFTTNFKYMYIVLIYYI